MRICIVDDNILSRDATSLTLSDAGHEVAFASDAASAWAALDACPFGAVCIDYDLGADKGDALATLLRKRFPELIIVLMSGALPANVDPAACGADLFLEKPFTPKAMLHALGDLERRRGAAA